MYFFLYTQIWLQDVAILTTNAKLQVNAVVVDTHSEASSKTKTAIVRRQFYISLQKSCTKSLVNVQRYRTGQNMLKIFSVQRRHQVMLALYVVFTDFSQFISNPTLKMCTRQMCVLILLLCVHFHIIADRSCIFGYSQDKKEIV